MQREKYNDNFLDDMVCLVRKYSPEQLINMALVVDLRLLLDNMVAHGATIDELEILSEVIATVVDKTLTDEEGI